MRRDILYVIGDLELGGAERHLVQTLPRLLNRGFRPKVYVLTRKGRLAPQLEAAGVEVIAPPLADLLRKLPKPLRVAVMLPVTVSRLSWLLVARRPAIVHFFLPEAYLIGGLLSLLFGPSLRVMSRRSLNMYQRRHPYATRLERRLHSRMSAVLGNSRAVLRQLLEEGVEPARAGLIYNGIDLTPYAVVAPREQTRAAAGIAPDTFVLILVANLIPYKGHADLLHALGSIRATMPPGWVLLCVGRDDGIGAELRELATRHGISANVRWLGERMDIPALLTAADVGLLSSHEEGFSNVVLEGMAAALPMVVTDVGGNAEAILEGECGLVVEARKPDAMAQAIQLLAGDPALRARLGKAARLRVRSFFSLDSAVDAYTVLYESLLRGAPPPKDESLRIIGSMNRTASAG